MFKPQKPQPQNQPSRQRLPMVDRPPKQEDIAALFTGAMRIRGCNFELPIRPHPYGKTYLVTCHFDPTANETVWAMYEGEDGALPIFNNPHTDLDLVFDMVCMGCQSQGQVAPTALPPELQKQHDPYASAPQQQQSPPPQPVPQPQYAPPQQQQYPPNPYPPQQQPPYPQQQPQQQPYPAAAPPYPQQAPYQQPQPGYPQQAYPPAQQPYPQQQQPYYPGNPTPAGPAPAPYPQYQQPAPVPQPAPQPAPAPAPTPPQQQPYQPQPSAGAGAIPEMSNFIDLISKGTPNLLLGHLLTEANIVPQPCLDAALKCQEMVRTGRLTNEQAVRALKRAAELGGILDDEILHWARDPDAARRSTRPASNPQSTGQVSPPKDNPSLLKVLELLKQAGLVSDADLETARKVRAKHGGDLGQILVSAGKVGGKTLDAANQCQEFVTHGRLRIDQAIMALHYCERMRAGLKEALEELSISLS